jgi:hypothetical protein
MSTYRQEIRSVIRLFQEGLHRDTLNMHSHCPQKEEWRNPFFRDQLNSKEENMRLHDSTAGIGQVPVCGDHDSDQPIAIRVMNAGQALIEALAAESALSGERGATPGDTVLLQRWKACRAAVTACQETYDRWLSRCRESLQQR